MMTEPERKVPSEQTHMPNWPIFLLGTSMLLGYGVLHYFRYHSVVVAASTIIVVIATFVFFMHGARHCRLFPRLFAFLALVSFIVLDSWIYSILNKDSTAATVYYRLGFIGTPVFAFGLVWLLRSHYRRG